MAVPGIRAGPGRTGPGRAGPDCPGPGPGPGRAGRATGSDGWQAGRVAGVGISLRGSVSGRRAAAGPAARPSPAARAPARRCSESESPPAARAAGSRYRLGRLGLSRTGDGPGQTRIRRPSRSGPAARIGRIGRTRLLRRAEPALVGVCQQAWGPSVAQAELHLSVGRPSSESRSASSVGVRRPGTVRMRPGHRGSRPGSARMSGESAGAAPRA